MPALTSSALGCGDVRTVHTAEDASHVIYMGAALSQQRCKQYSISVRMQSQLMQHARVRHAKSRHGLPAATSTNAQQGPATISQAPCAPHEIAVNTEP
jgi:hypothetical protein